MKKPLLKLSKKEPFFNVLLHFLRKAEFTYTVLNNHLHITSGCLKSLLIWCERTRVSVRNLVQNCSDIVRIEADFVVNYSIEAFLYKLYKFNYIDEAKYNYLVSKWQNA